MDPGPGIDVLLLDLGGVIVELAGLPQWSDWTGSEDDAEVWRRWLHSPAVRAFESGACTVDEFADSIVREFALPIGPDEFIGHFASWPRGLHPGARALLDELTLRPYRVACFSNTNALHWPRFLGDMGLGEVFDAHFASHELGLLKPDRPAFARVVEELGCPSERVLFLDDNQINVDGARSAGLQAECVRGPDGVREKLALRDLL